MTSQKGQKIYDAHMHVEYDIQLEEGLENFRKRMEGKHIRGGTVLAAPIDDKRNYIASPVENVSALYYKETLPGIFTAFAGFEGHSDDPDYYLNFAKHAMEMGFDGFKSLLGLPYNRKLAGKGVNHPSFEKFFAYLEAEGLPFTLHTGNPAIYWDLENAPEAAKRLGRVYDSSYLTLDELYQEAESLLERHPKLHITFAHFLFMGDNHDRLKKLMDTYENITLDLAPAAEVFADMANAIPLWKEFFITYQHRILFGSDTYVAYPTLNTPLADAVCNFLETTGPYTCRHNGLVIPGLDLDVPVLKNICWDNAIRLRKRNPLNKEKIVAECQRILRESDSLIGHDRENLEIIIRDFSK